jgi:hypothetical protein
MPYYSTGCSYNDFINNFSTTGGVLNISNNNSGCNGTLPNSYTYNSNMTVSQFQGMNVNISVQSGGSWSQGFRIWIDWNHDFDFSDVGEDVWSSGSASTSVFTGSITVPIGALPGITRMRVLCSFASVPNQSAFCGINYSFGECEDYNFEILGISACSGLPAPGKTFASTSIACIGENINLTLQNQTNSSGVTYQWYNNAGPILGASNATLSVTANSNDTYYCAVTCSGTTVNSTPTTISIRNFLECYCIPVMPNGCGTTHYISNVTFESSFTPINNTSGSCQSLGYSNYTTSILPANVTQGDAILPGGIKVEINNGGQEFAGAWIDFNHDANFSASEYILLTDEDGAAPWIYTNATVFVIPAITLTGLTRIRVRSQYNSTILPNTACSAYYTGEIEDYLIYIHEIQPCNGLPNTANIVASTNTVCPGDTVYFSLQNQISQSGIAYQWYNNGGAITGATNSYYIQGILSPDSIYCSISCGGGNSIFSNGIGITTSNFNCYCAANSQTGSSGGYYGLITNVTFDSINNSSGFPLLPPNYTNYQPGNNTTTHILPGSVHTINVTLSKYTQAAVWIDFDQSGTFDTYEFTYIGSNPNSAPFTFNTNISFPTGLLPGQTKMRIRSEAQSSSTSNSFTFNPSNSCGNTYVGETEDYTIYIDPLPICSNVTNPGNTLASESSVCFGVTVLFTLQNNTNASALNYQWYSKIQGLIQGATNSYYSQPINTTDTFWCEVKCPISGQNEVSNYTVVNMKDFLECYCTSSPAYTYDEEIYKIIINNNVTPSLYSDINSCINPAPGTGSILNRYSNFKNLGALTTVSKDQTVSFSIFEDECDGAAYFQCGIAMWIDYNHNGSFLDAGEKVYGEQTTASGPRTAIGTFTVPSNALSGITAMRVTAAEGFAGSALTPCLNYSFGETEDWLINIIPATITSLFATTACNSYTWSKDGQTYISSGIYTSTNINSSGALVIDSLNLTINNSTTSNIAITACDSYFWQGVTYTSSGSYINTTTNNSGCDSIEILNLIINNSSGSLYYDTVCNSYSWNVSGQTYNQSGIFTISSLNSVGCPHVDSLLLIVHDNIIDTISIISCDSYQWAGLTYTVDGYYTHTFNSTFGCDSVVTIILTINSSSNSSNSATACNSYVWNTQTYTQSGTYTFTSLNAAGCTHTQTLVLTLNSSTSSNSSATAINSYTWLVAAQTYTQSGTYTYTSLNAAGCTYTQSLALTIQQATVLYTISNLVQTANNQFAFDVWATNTGNTALNVRSLSFGLNCSPGLGTLSFTYLSGSKDALFNSISTYTASSALKGSGANSYYHLRLSTGNATSGNEPLLAANTPVKIGRFRVSASGNFSNGTNPFLPPSGVSALQLLTASGFTQCVLNARINSSSTVYSLYGTGNAATGTALNSLSAQMQPSPSSSNPFLLYSCLPTGTSNSVTACGSYTWTMNGQTYTQSGTYTHTSLNASGCTHTDTLQLNIQVCETELHLGCLLEGYYDGNAGMMPVLQNQGEATTAGACDTIQVELHSDTAPYFMEASTHAVLQQNGTAICIFPIQSGSKYIVVKHRNAIETWSAQPINMGAVVNYDFRTAASQAYGGNQQDVSGNNSLYALYSGDINQDGNIDLYDLLLVNDDIENFIYGYYATDITGDGNVDLYDLLILENNITNFIYAIQP